MEILALIFIVGTSVLLSLGFVFVGVFLVRGIIKAVRGEQIFPAEVGPEETRRLFAVEKAAREALNNEPEKSAAMLSLSVALHELDSTRDKAKLKEAEKCGESGR